MKTLRSLEYIKEHNYRTRQDMEYVVVRALHTEDLLAGKKVPMMSFTYNIQEFNTIEKLINAMQKDLIETRQGVPFSSLDAK